MTYRPFVSIQIDQNLYNIVLDLFSLLHSDHMASYKKQWLYSLMFSCYLMIRYPLSRIFLVDINKYVELDDIDVNNNDKEGIDIIRAISSAYI